MRWVFVLVILFLAGCSEAQGLNNVRDAMGTKEVVKIPHGSGHFIAKKEDGSIWYAYSSGISNQVVDIVMLFPPCK